MNPVSRKSVSSGFRPLALALLSALGIGWAAQTGRTGGRFDVGGYRLDLHCTAPAPGPTVLLLGGLEEATEAWPVTAYDVARTHRVCWYAMAGVSPSDPAPGVTDGVARAEELHRLLIRAGVKGPFVLVAYRFGSQIARLYTDRHRTNVAGMVLVNPWQEDLAPALDAFFRQNPPVLDDLGSAPANRYTPPSPLGGVRALQQFVRAYTVGASTWKAGWNIRAGDAQVRRAAPLGELPLVVVTPHLDAFSVAQAGTLKSMYGQRLWRILGDSQARLTRLSHNSDQVFSEVAWDAVQNEDPGLVLGALRRVLTVAQGSSALGR
ncbi:alpha/beta fold hydrolase [Deinococcus apachensis]|uniref:alpha/beta fold hydrolase n=1 Tax=Deinococcus apachensis TaxID=309886 RepID=UPI00037FE8D6|nr:alpha/beta hydrolase [Deinococcus apachensis]